MNILTSVNKFSEFLERAYLSWQNQSGKRKTLDEFADYIGEKRPLVSAWLNGSRKPGLEKTEHLADLFGLDVYDALDLPHPDPKLHYVTRHWEDIPEDVQRKVTEEVSKYTTEPMPDGETSSPNGQ